MSHSRSLPRSRLERLGQLGRLAGGIAAGALNAGTRQLLQGQRPRAGDMLLTPANAQRLSERLSEMRGAAMKIGQLLSMDSGQLLPEQLSEALARLRDDAHPMPLGEVGQVLTQAWGRGWEQQFRRFNFTPLAAASIGQVHKAELKDGKQLAIKLQYPGIRESIDSDVDNVGRLLKLLRQIPSTLDFNPLLEEAKRQLHLEADYRHEADLLLQYSELISGDERFALPRLFTALTTEQVLAMSYLEGEPIDESAHHSADERDRIAGSLLELALRELFEWGLVQTDPNFSNYRYDATSDRIQLLDFGAVRSYPCEQRQALRNLLSACLIGDRRLMADTAESVGYLATEDPAAYRDQVVSLLCLVSEPLQQSHYQFGSTDLVDRMSRILIEMRLQGSYGRLPPPEILFLHRKLGGLYLLFAKLKSRLPVRQLVEKFLVNGPST
jgi:predicted unusual protein kinase regulating ubiquinone biosynthesis (AarF/ABC1/UbiB family)